MRLLKLAIRLPKQLSFSALLILSFFLINCSLGFADTPAHLSERIADLEKKLTEIQKQQETILAKTQELSEKLDTVKVWAHRG